MRFQIGLILIFCVINANTFVLDKPTRSKRSPQDTFFGKVKTGFTNFAQDVKKITNKGVEEVKNLFSSDRNVGDYRIDQIDVRFGENEDSNSTLSNIEDTNSVGGDESQSQRDKRQINEERHTMDDVVKNLEEQLEGQEHTSEGSQIRQTTLENNAEVSPGFPHAITIIYAPLKCGDGQKYVKDRCRTIV